MIQKKECFKTMNNFKLERLHVGCSISNILREHFTSSIDMEKRVRRQLARAIAEEIEDQIVLSSHRDSFCGVCIYSTDVYISFKKPE